jgi:hypothetical protein
VTLEQAPAGSKPNTTATTSPRLEHPRRWIAAGIVLVVALFWLAFQLQTGVAGSDIANPQAPIPLPAFTWLGVSVTKVWQPVFYLLTSGAAILLLVIFYRHWRRTGRRHPGLSLFAILFIGLIYDPLFNWAMYVPYDPALLHWPTTWPLINVVPTVEPLWILVGAYQAFFLAPAIAVNALFRRYLARTQARTGTTRATWMARHPLWSLAIIGFVVGVAFDVFAELWMMNIGIYKYSQIPGRYITWGNSSLGLLEIHWSALQICLLSVLLFREDRGRSTYARISGTPLFRRLHLGEFGTALLIMVTFFTLYGGCYALLRIGGLANDPANGWPQPYRAAKTYDPQHILRDAGLPGPYRDGLWCTGPVCGRGPTEENTVGGH